jgi:hypothetical protein
MSVVANYVRLPPELLARWRNEPGLIDAICGNQYPEAEHLDLDRAWDGLSWLLSEKKRQSKAAHLSEDDTPTAAPAPPDIAWRVLEGVATPEEPKLNFGYGAARVIDSATVVQASKHFNSLIQADLRSVFDPDAMDEHEIAPLIWQREGRAAVEDYLLPYFERLRAFLRRASEAKQPVVVFFG